MIKHIYVSFIAPQSLNTHSKMFSALPDNLENAYLSFKIHVSLLYKQWLESLKIILTS